MAIYLPQIGTEIVLTARVNTSQKTNTAPAPQPGTAKPFSNNPEIIDPALWYGKKSRWDDFCEDTLPCVLFGIGFALIAALFVYLYLGMTGGAR